MGTSYNWDTFGRDAQLSDLFFDFLRLGGFGGRGGGCALPSVLWTESLLKSLLTGEEDLWVSKPESFILQCLAVSSTALQLRTEFRVTSLELNVWLSGESPGYVFQFGRGGATSAESIDLRTNLESLFEAHLGAVGTQSNKLSNNNSLFVSIESVWGLSWRGIS